VVGPLSGRIDGLPAFRRPREDAGKEERRSNFGLDVDEVVLNNVVCGGVWGRTMWMSGFRCGAWKCRSDGPEKTPAKTPQRRQSWGLGQASPGRGCAPPSFHMQCSRPHTGPTYHRATRRRRRRRVRAREQRRPCTRLLSGMASSGPL
jgi:hypothetical protein